MLSRILVLLKIKIVFYELNFIRIVKLTNVSSFYSGYYLTCI